MQLTEPPLFRFVLMAIFGVVMSMHVNVAHAAPQATPCTYNETGFVGGDCALGTPGEPGDTTSWTGYSGSCLVKGYDQGACSAEHPCHTWGWGMRPSTTTPASPVSRA